MVQKPNISAKSVLAILIACIFITELLVMGLLAALPPIPPVLQALLDGSLLAILVLPALYLFSTRPLVQILSERKKVGNALNTERQRLFTLLDQLPLMVYLIAPDLTIRFANKHCQKLFGDPTGDFCYSHFHNNRRPCETCYAHKVLEDKESDEWVWKSQDGKYYHVYNFPFADADGSPLLLEIAVDITERRTAEEQVKRRNQELSALNAVNVTVSKSLDLPEVLASLQQYLLNELNFSAGALYTCDRANHHFRLEISWGLPGQLAQKISGENSAGAFNLIDSASLKEVVIFSDLNSEDEFIAGELSRFGPDWTSYVHVPLLAQDQVRGVLELFTAAPVRFSGSETSFFKALGHTIGTAIQNSHLYQDEMRTRQKAETLRSASQELTKSLELETVLDTLLEYIHRLVSFDVGQVVLMEGTSRPVVRAMLTSEAVQVFDRNTVQNLEEKASAYILDVFDSQESLVIADTKEHPNREFIAGHDFVRSFMAAPLIADGKVIGLCKLGKDTPGYFNHEHVLLAEALVDQAAIAIQNAWLFEQLRAGRERLQYLSYRLVEVQETERRYVARELHDEASQALTSLILGLGLLERDAHRPEAVAKGLSELRGLVDGVLENIHRLAMDLWPASLDHLGLVGALEQHIESFSNASGLVIELENAGLNERLPYELETSIYRIIQEALTNVARHAQATRVDVLLKRRGEDLIIIVEDNGIGFDPDLTNPGSRLGLFGMQERVEMLGGKMVIESAVGTGTTLLVEVPYEHTSSDR